MMKCSNYEMSKCSNDAMFNCSIHDERTFCDLLMSGRLVSGLLHPGQSQASLDQNIEELATEMHQSLSYLQH